MYRGDEEQQNYILKPYCYQVIFRIIFSCVFSLFGFLENAWKKIVEICNPKDTYVFYMEFFPYNFR